MDIPAGLTVPGYLVEEWGSDHAKHALQAMQKAVEAETGKAHGWTLDLRDRIYRLVPMDEV